MTGPLNHVLVPHERFLGYQDRRRRIAAGLPERDEPPVVDVDVMPAPSPERLPERGPTR
jgi:hypothetical protein